MTSAAALLVAAKMAAHTPVLTDQNQSCRFEEASQLCRTAISILEQSMGEDNVNVASALAMQAKCLRWVSLLL